jgi:ABC-2 type transport system permease protein
MMGYLTLELRRTLRDRRYVAMVVAWPAASYLLFSTVFGAAANRAEGLNPKTEIMVAMAAFGAMGAVLLATGPRMAYERQAGWLRQMRLTPLSPMRVLTVRAAAAMVMALPPICITFVVAVGVKGVRLAAWEWGAMVGLLVVGCLPFAAIGVVIGTVTDGDSATGLTMMSYLTLSALGGLWMPVKILPRFLQAVAHALPSNRLAELGWRTAGGGSPPLAAVLVLVAWFAGATAVAAGLARRVTAGAL